MTLETATTFINITLVGLTLFCAQLLLLRRRDVSGYGPLALLFLFMGVSTLSHVYVDMTGDLDRVSAAMRIRIIFAMLEIACPFLFWLYVRALTSEDPSLPIPNLRRHLIAIFIVAALVSSVLFLPAGLNDTDLPEDHPDIARLLLILMAIVIADLLFQIMVAVYLYLVFQRLKAHHARLREIFSSTENRELTWIWGITIAGSIFWALNLALSVVIWSGALGIEEDNGILLLLGRSALLVLLWAIGIWGLRQRAVFKREPLTDPQPPETPLKKYEKSALSDERAARISTKIDAAMRDDLLYRDPNLSLWDLAKHIGVTSHYVSQTLNTKMDSSFFDYVNRWRIDDAIEQLGSTDESILMISYDVGFNSRSAFYKAFKRQTGKTPSEYRV